ncbi:DNA-3-methyladenine glycosylase [Candidatus Woesearchaeota archaeon]|nr:DNA-3-methyladenine glycosylase [Candidatus Woesearchaeota archaeon]
MKQLALAFFSRDTVTVAKELLGKVIEANGFRGRIVETEAYGDDKASHARTRTERSAVMHDTYGHVYVYLIYGMYHCLNFTSSREPGAVLIRAVEPLNNFEVLQQRRKTTTLTNLCSGPGKVCQAFAIDKSFSGAKLGGKIKVFDDGFVVKNMGKSKRIGIKEDVHLEWRFFIERNEFVSRK